MSDQIVETVEEPREIDRYYDAYLSRLRDIVELSAYDDGDDVPEEIFDRLDITSRRGFLADSAWEAAESSVYAVERLAVVEDDGTVGELRSVELLLGGGGPTITLTAQVRDEQVRGFTLWHSWGSSVGEEASMEARCAADVDTVGAILQILGVFA